MPRSSLDLLVGGYFHQEMFDLYDDEFSAVDAFVASSPDEAADLPREISVLLAQHATEEALGSYLRQLGLTFSPDGLSYRDWLTRIADHVRAAT